MIEKQKAFTLLEFVIYSTLVTIIVGLLVLISANVLGARARIIAQEEVSHNARFALGRITSEIRNSRAIVTASGSSLRLIDADGDTVGFDLAGGVLRINKGNGLPVALTSESVVVSALQFINVSYPATPGTIRIIMTVEFSNPLGRPEWDFKRTFHTTENVRK